MPSDRTKRHGQFLLRLTGMNVAISLLAVLIFGRVSWTTPWRDMAATFAIAMLFSFWIGPLCYGIIPRLAPPVWRRFGFPVNWAILIATMVALATAGSLAAEATLWAIGYFDNFDLVWFWLARSLRISIILTLTVGIFVTVSEMLRAKLDAATLELRTKERDEAEARRLAAEAQLASLESRVQPHFLFNTLNSISALIPQDPAGAEKMTGQLASLLRSSLDSAPDALITIDREIENVRNYLEIERVRFGDRLRFAIDVAPGLRDSPVPRLALQTLVENSVKYSVAPRREGGTILIRGQKLDDVVRLEVSDDGPGFDSQAVAAGHGLSLIRDRLRMTFGDTARLDIKSRPGATTVAIQLPHHAARLSR